MSRRIPLLALAAPFVVFGTSYVTAGPGGNPKSGGNAPPAVQKSGPVALPNAKVVNGPANAKPGNVVNTNNNANNAKKVPPVANAKDWKNFIPFPNYHLQFGKAFVGGIYYPGQFHRHWSYCIWDVRYGCYCYWDPCVRTYCYWCQPDRCYYPVSHCPYRTYCWTQPVCATCALPAPADTRVQVLPCQTCPPAAVTTTATAAPTAEPPVLLGATQPVPAIDDAVPAVPAPLVALRGDR